MDGDGDGRQSPDDKSEKARLEPPAQQLTTSGPSPVFDDGELSVDVPSTFELEEESPGMQKGAKPEAPRSLSNDRSPGASPDSQKKGTPLATMGVLGRSTRSADMLTAGERYEMASPRDKGGFESGEGNWRVWAPFLLFGVTAILNWSVTFAIGSAWDEFGHRLYFYASFSLLWVLQGWQGTKLAGLLEGTSASVQADLTPGIRWLLGVFSGWLGLAPAMLAFTSMRHGIDHIAFNINFNRLTVVGLLGVMLPLVLLQFFVGVHEAWLDQSHANYSQLLAASVIANVASAAFTIFAWEAVSRNPGSTEIIWDATTSFYGVLAILARSLELGLVLAWVAMLPCVGLMAAALPAAFGLGGYGLYVYAASGYDGWSPRFALLWALIQFSLVVVILLSFTYLSDDNDWNGDAGGDSDSSASNGTVGVAASVLAAGEFEESLELWEWVGGHCFAGVAHRDFVEMGAAGAVASLLVSLLALLIDPQVGAVGCLRTKVFTAEHYSSLFGPSESRGDAATREFEIDMTSSQDNESGDGSSPIAVGEVDE